MSIIPISISRVNQVDAQRLDIEMSAMLKEQLVKVFSLVKPGLLFQYEPELDAFLEFLIWRFSIWVDMPTPGNALMNLRYRDERAIEPRGKGLEREKRKKTCKWGSMKFGKRLKQQVQETLPGWHDKFLSYKDLKKLVRSISSAPPMMNGSLEFGKAEAEFMYLLNNEIEKFNSFFMEQEEDFVIRHKELQQRIERVTEIWGPNGSQPLEMDYKEEMGKIKKEIVNFPGEMVLLMNYSNINYTGLANILKKYDKRTDGLLRSPFIRNVLQQPFCTTDFISKLVEECESTINAMFPMVEEGIIRGEREAMMVLGEGVFRNTVAALLTVQEIRRGSSTYGHFSLPPLNLSNSDFFHAFQHNSPIPIP